MSLQSYPALVLNADFQPLSFLPLSVWSWQDAVKAVVRESHVVVEAYEKTVHSPSITMRLPSVIALRDYVSPDRPAALTRASIFVRDGNMCAYCGETFRMDELTFDHVVPRAQGGCTTWLNTTSSCGPCNLRKGNRTPQQANMPLLQKPYRPSIRQLNERARARLKGRYPASWKTWIGADSAGLVFLPEAVQTPQPISSAFPPEMTSEAYWNVEIDA